MYFIEVEHIERQKMKILSNKEYNKLLNDKKAIENTKNESEFQYKKQIQEYDFLIEEINYDLSELLAGIKSNMNKDKIKAKIQNIIKKVGG